MHTVTIAHLEQNHTMVSKSVMYFELHGFKSVNSDEQKNIALKHNSLNQNSVVNSLPGNLTCHAICTCHPKFQIGLSLEFG